MSASRLPIDGVDVVRSATLQDGRALHVGIGQFIIGTRPLTNLEMAGAQARYTVRAGLVDVLEWLGESVGPAPQRSGRGDAALLKIRERFGAHP